MAWYPPSTWRISPVIPDAQSDRRNTAAFATGVGSPVSHPSGARSPHPSANASNPGMPFAATVRSGPA